MINCLRPVALTSVHHLLVLPGVDPGPIDHFLAREDIGDLLEEQAAAIRDHAGEDGRNIESFCQLRQGGRVVDHCLRIVAVQVRELVRLVVDQNEYGVFGTKKRIKAVTKGHYYFLCCRCE